MLDTSSVHDVRHVDSVALGVSPIGAAAAVGRQLVDLESVDLALVAAVVA